MYQRLREKSLAYGERTLTLSIHQRIMSWIVEIILVVFSCEMNYSRKTLEFWPQT